jgi:diguanylate cyclase (GGDEF)-like protein
LTAELQTVPDSLLIQVLGQSEHIHELIKQSAEELSSINTGVAREPANSDPLPGVNAAPDKNEAVRRLLQEASKNLTAVNQTLQVEIRARTMVDHQLAAAVEQEEGARNAALHDPLTGLANRILFKDRLDHGIAQARRHGWILAVMFLDLDDFKSINDTHGHEAGDAVLRAVAKRLAHNARTDDTVSRYGGDEFLYLLAPLQEQKDIAMIAAKILKAIQAPCEVRVDGVVVQLSLGASIGISLFPKDGATAAALIRRADDAMYGAKESRSGFAFAR